jgi:hypothetical protein
VNSMSTATPEIVLGSRVFLRACRADASGTVIRFERGRFTVYWPDMDFWSKHQPEALGIAIAEPQD